MEPLHLLILTLTLGGASVVQVKGLPVTESLLVPDTITPEHPLPSLEVGQGSSFLLSKQSSNNTSAGGGPIDITLTLGETNQGMAVGLDESTAVALYEGNSSGVTTVVTITYSSPQTPPFEDFVPADANTTTL